MSGTDAGKDEKALGLLEEVFDCRLALDPLTALVAAVNERPANVVDLTKAAIGLDSSVFIRLATHRRSADILDYLLRHDGPLILPGQAIQEFWNNRLAVIDTVSSSLRKKFAALAADIKKVDAQFDEFEHETTEMLDRLQEKFGYVYDEKTKARVARMLEILRDRASCRFVPRSRFSRIAEMRKRAKTPPGFKDEGDGDFYVWADFLFGLLTWTPRADGQSFDRILLLTNDQKPDWSTNGKPHPTLAAEVEFLFKVPFDLWPLETFVDEVAQSL